MCDKALKFLTKDHLKSFMLTLFLLTQKGNIGYQSKAQLRKALKVSFVNVSKVEHL